MELVKAEVTVSKEAYELGLALAKLVVEAKKALADGAQASDIPALMATIMSSEFTEGLKGMDKLGEEMKENKGAFIAAFVVAGTKLSDAM